MARPRILVSTPYFLPSQQGGGSVVAVQWLTHHLASHFDFVIATGMRDLNGRHDFTDSACAATRQETALDIRYLGQGRSPLGWWRQLLDERWDLLYFNSLLSPRFTALPLLLEQGRARARLVAPRGEWMPGALVLKRRRKQAWLAALRTTGALRSIHWHATSLMEAEVLRDLKLGPVWLAPDLPPRARTESPTLLPPMRQELALVYLSRIDRKKNLGMLIDALCAVRSPVRLTIHGPIADEHYWRACQRKLQDLPSHVQARYEGELPPSRVLDALAQHDLFVLPTLGENHGYVVGEALLAGCPVLISDQTPWNDYRRDGALRSFSISKIEALTQAIDDTAAQTAEARQRNRLAAKELGKQALEATQAMNATRLMFDAIIGASNTNS